MAGNPISRRVSVLALGRLPGATAGRRRVPLLVAIATTFGGTIAAARMPLGAVGAARSSCSQLSPRLHFWLSSVR